MRTPSITDYIRTLENPDGVFRTLEDVEVARDVYRDIELRAGNSAAVFTYLRGGERRLLKCYIRPNPRLRPIYDYVERNRPALLPGMRLLREELYVDSVSGEDGWADVVEGEWIEGQTLDAAVCGAARSGDQLRLRELAITFDTLCRELLEQDWAHGDLKPENIVVRADGSLMLIDCDAMWLPEFAGEKAAELGTPGCRHPGRDASHFSKRIDDYPMLLISASLHAIALAPDLYQKHHTADNLLLSPVEVIDGKSAAHAEILALFAREGMAAEYRMAETLASPFPEIENAERFFFPPSKSETGVLISFVDDGKWGFADAGGTVVMPAFWDEVLEFRGDRAAVRLAEWWHFIDRTGSILDCGLSRDEMKKSL